MNYEETPEFEKEFKKLSGNYPSLKDDLEVAKTNAIELRHVQGLDNRNAFEIPGFCSDDVKVLKLKKFACKALKGKGVRSGIRIIYAFHKKENKIVFIEIYYKGKKNNEDRARIREYLFKNN
ncbi:MAG: hypothetical protein ABH856_04475 [Patescibacteria group bacterium]|nr:hypothetical protein [Patescibacteria group bacterium]